MKKLLKTISDLIFPEEFTCELCGRETFGARFCPDCQKRIVKNDGIACPVCGRREPFAGVCAECKAVRPLFDYALSPLVYADGSAELIGKFKNGGAYLCDYLAELINTKLIGEDFDIIVPVPASKKAKKRRGYDQTALLAKSLSEKTGVPYAAAVVSAKKTAEQKTLSKRGRAKNLQGAFKIANRKDVKGKRVLALDDVMTTGATLDEMTKVLKSAGAQSVLAATVASVEHEKKDGGQNLYNGTNELTRDRIK